MAPRRKGAFELNEVVETPKTMPLDARQLVRSKEEMLDPDSFPSGYNGMIVGERTEGKLYMLMDKDNPTLEASWKVIGPYEGSPSGPVTWDDVQNKPTFATVATSGSYNDLSDQPSIPEAYDDTEVRGLIATKANSADLAPVATSGSYNDLDDKPSIPEAYDDTEVRGLIAAKANSADLATVAISGSYNDLGDKPSIPEAYDDTALAARVTAVENGKANSADLAPVATSGSYNDLGDKPSIPEAYDDTEVRNLIAAKANSADLAPVATSGSYNDLGDKPSIPEAYDDTEVRGLIAAKANSADLATVATSGSYNDLGDKPTIPAAYDDTEVRGLIAAKANSADLAAVATSGSYNDLGDKPTIPPAYDDTALAARVTAVEADLGGLATVASSGSYNDLSDKPTIPAEVTVDAAMSDTSENPVQNKVVLAAIGDAIDVVEANVYTKSETDALLDGKASLQVAAIPGGGGGEEINALVSQGENSVSVSYYKDGALPNTLNLNVDSDYFTIPTTGYADEKAAQAQSNAQIYADLKLAQKQNTLVSGQNIKTINGQPVVGSGDLILHQGVGDGLDLNDMPSYNQLEQMINNNALLYIDGNWLVTGLELESTTAQVISEYADKERRYYFDTDYNLDAPLIYGGTYTEGCSTKPSMVVNADSSQPYGEFTRGDGQTFRFWGLDQRIGIDFTDRQGRQQRRNYDIGVNIKVGEEKWQGTYTDENGETFQVYSKMVYIPALPATAGVTTYDHGVANIKQILNIYGFTTDGFVLNAPRQNVQDNITIYQASKSATNQTFSIEVGKDRSNKAAYVVMVYAKNN